MGRLIHERSLGAQSRFAPYVAVLPALEELTLPLVWTPREVALLHPSRLYDDVTQLRSAATQELENAREFFASHPIAPHLTLEAWLWAWGVTMSRPYALVGPPF
jgi:hypothetical protein